MRFIIGVVIAFLGSVVAADAQTVAGNCGMQLGGTAIFCETFDNKNPGIPSRTGDLDPNVWGVSRLSSNINIGQGMYNIMPPVHIQKCDSTTPLVSSPNNIVICNGQLREASNDNLYGTFEGGGVSVLAMYPKQPFDFAGRTGTVSFDVSNDTHGTHAAWPEFWVSDLPVPAPFFHGSGIGRLVPQNAFGIRFDGKVGLCDANSWTLGSVVVVRNYLLEDSEIGGSATVTRLDCVVAPVDNSGITNHVEIKVSQNQIDVYATDAGTTAPLKHIAVINNANLTLTRGLIWLEDAHYNADKAETGPDVPSQREHTFVWDNVAFDGPFTYRDFSYDALDALTPYIGGGVVAGAVNLGKNSVGGQSSSWNVLNIPANPQAAAVRVLFNFYHEDDTISLLNVTVNGHAHSAPWPYPDKAQGAHTFAVTVPITDLVSGTNVVQIGADRTIVTSNVNIVLVNVPGGVPVLPGSNNTYPVSVPPPPPPPPPPTATISANPTNITSGRNSTLAWASTNATSCVASGAWSGAKPVNGSVVVTPLSTATYTLTCSGSGGTSPVARATVVVQPKTCTITIAPFTFPEGQPPTTFSAQVTANCQ